MTTDRNLQCLSREVWDIAQRPFEQRRMYLHEVEKSRGKAEADRLRAALMQFWEEEKLAQLAQCCL
jgi:hypothetical protein